MIEFFKKFNCPALILEAIGYIVVAVSLVVVIAGIIAILRGSENGLTVIGIGIVNAIVSPQLFFALAKVVKAAEKYLSE